MGISYCIIAHLSRFVNHFFLLYGIPSKICERILDILHDGGLERLYVSKLLFAAQLMVKLDFNSIPVQHFIYTDDVRFEIGALRFFHPWAGRLCS